MGSEDASGACYRCGSSSQSGRYCRNCGAGLLSLASSPGSPRFIGSVKSPFVRGALAALACVMLPVGALFVVLRPPVAASGICLANPLARTSLWPYSPATNSLSLSYYFEQGPPSPYRRAYQKATKGAFGAWTKAWPVLHFRRAATQSKAQIVIRYGNFGTVGRWFDHAGLTLPDVDVFGCNLIHAEIDINNSYLIHNGTLEYPQPMLRHLLLHEIGHALGLKHAHGPIASVMVPTSDAYRYIKPQPYDIRTLAVLYPSASGTQELAFRLGTQLPKTAAVNYPFRAAPPQPAGIR